MFRRGPRISLVAAIYIAIGIFVAWDHNFACGSSGGADISAKGLHTARNA
jgi:hypothetical protein